MSYCRRRRRGQAFQSDRDGGARAEVEPLARAAVSMAPEVLPRLKALATALARVRPRGRVDPLVEMHSRRVLESLAADAALARIVVAVFVQIVLLQVHLNTTHNSNNNIFFSVFCFFSFLGRALD